MKLRHSWLLIVACCLAWMPAGAPALASGSLAWVSGLATFDSDHCYAFPTSTGGPERAVFACFGGADAELFLAFRVARRTVPIEHRPRLPSASFDLETFVWQPGMVFGTSFHQFKDGDPALPGLGDQLRQAVRSSPDNLGRLWLEPGTVLTMAMADTEGCSALDLQAAAIRVRVDCGDPAGPASETARELRGLAFALGGADLHLEAWSDAGRYLLDGYFYASRGAPGRRVIDTSELAGRLARAESVVAFQSGSAGPLDEAHRRLRIALVHRQPERLAALTRDRFVQSPELYLLDFPPGGGS